MIALSIKLFYNRIVVGVWCSGNTWASDSQIVGSIPTTPANRSSTDERFYFLSVFACYIQSPSVFI